MRRALGLASCLALAACGGHRGGLKPGDAGGQAGAPGTGAAGADGGAGTTSQDGSVETSPTAVDPGWTGLRRLTDSEYDNTMRDLLGVATSAYRAFVERGDEDVPGGFDTFAAAQTITPQRYQWTYASAVEATEAAFSDPAFAARNLACAIGPPAVQGVDDECSRKVLRAFGLRAWRRPLEDAEVEDLVSLVRDVRRSTLDYPGALVYGFVALLTSEAFLFRVELDPVPGAPAPHPVTPYDLATRLSYLLWSSTPDDALLTRAGEGALADEAALRAEVKRMLADPRAGGFVRNFAGQWLDFRRLEDRSLVWWPAGVQLAALEEARRFVEMLVAEDRPLTDLLTADVNFVDAALAGHYRLTAPAAGVARVSETTDSRKGYLGLVAPLALTSRETETSPTWRGHFVRERLLCQEVPPGPNNSPRPPGATPRERADSLAGQAGCASCHTLLDPIGLGLEGFDPLGRDRVGAPGGPATEPGGYLDGEPFSGERGLADLLAADPRYPSCVARKALSYALGRRLEDADGASVDRIVGALGREGQTVRGLLNAIVVDDVFRLRRGEGP